MFDYPLVRVVAVEGLPTPEAVDWWSWAAHEVQREKQRAGVERWYEAGVNMTPEVDAVRSAPPVQRYVERLAGFAGQELGPAELRQYEQWSRESDERQRLREAGLLEEDDPFRTDGLWQQSYVAPPQPHTPPSIRLFGIGSHLAELVQDLKANEKSAAFVDPLNRCFGNLAEVIETAGDALLEPSIGRMCDELGQASDVRPDLAEKCADLARQLRQLQASGVADDELPF